MKITNELYRTILIMHVTGDVPTRTIAVLNDTFKKFAKSNIEYIFVNLTDAMIPEQAIYLARATKHERKVDGLKGLHLIGEISGLCDYRTYDQALKACPALEAALILQKRHLEIQIAKLQVQKDELERIYSSVANPEVQARRWELENRQLKRLKEVMIQEISRASSSTKGALLKTIPSYQRAVLSLLETEILKTLAEAKVLN